VYRCYDSEGRLLYIGCTQDLDARMMVHECDGDSPASVELMRRIDLLEYEEFPDRAAGLKAEREAIAAEAPLLNTHHNLGRGMKNLPPVERRIFVTDEQRAEFNAILANFGRAS
jgi:predicted GIY-YIG superfamily endonuclease